MNLTKYFGREFSWRKYNCWDFVREVWLDLSGTDIGPSHPKEYSREGFLLVDPIYEQEVINKNKLAQPIKEPITPCVALLRRPGIVSHIGIFINGNLFHLHPKNGVCYEPMSVATIGFDEVKFYK